MAVLIAITAVPSEDVDTDSSNVPVYAVADSAEKGAAEYTVNFGMDHGVIKAYVGGEPIKTGCSVADGTEITFSAAATSNYDIVSWRIGTQKEVSCESSMTLTVNGENLSVYVQTLYYMNSMNNNLFEGELPTDLDYVPAWQASPNGGVHGFRNMLYHPSVMGDYAYARNDHNIVMIDTEDGSLVKVLDTGTGGGFYQWVTVGNGQVADGCTGVVYDANLNPLFKLDKNSAKSFYSQGVYITVNNGVLYAYSAVDEDPESPDNSQSLLWSAEANTFASWGGPSQIMFGDGFLVTATTVKDPDTNKGRIGLATVSLADGTILDEIDVPQLIGGKINTGYLDVAEGYITLTVYGTGIFDSEENLAYNICSVKVGADGKMNHASLKTASTGASSQLSSLIISDGLGYVVGNKVAKVYKLDTLECIATSEECDQLAGHGSMVLSVYDGKVRGYNTPYMGCPDVGGFEYDVANGTIRAFVLEDVNNSQYGSGSPVVSENGTILQRNDSGYIAGIMKGHVVTLVLDNDTQKTYRVVSNGLFEIEGTDLYTDAAMTQVWDVSTPVTSDITLYSHASFIVSADVDNADIVIKVNGEIVDSGSSVPAGAEIEITVSPQLNYDIECWKVNGEFIDGFALSRVFTASSDVNVKVYTQYIMNSVNNNTFNGELPTVDDFTPIVNIVPEGGVHNFQNMIYHPIIVGDYVYARNDANILKINPDNGRVVKTVVNEKHTNFYQWLTAGSGVIADGSSGVVYDTNLNPVFKLDNVNMKIYYGYGMFVTVKGGSLYAYSAVDEDPEVADNVQTLKWSANVNAFSSWGGPANVLIGDGYLLTATSVKAEGDSKYSVGLATVSLKDGSVISTVDIPQFKGASINTGYLDLKDGVATMTVYGSGIFEGGDVKYNLAAINVADDGTLKERTLRVASTGGSSHLSSLIIVDGLGFVMGNGFVKVYDLGTLECIATSEENSLVMGHGSMVVGVSDGKVQGCLVPYGSNDGIAGFEYDVKAKTVRTYVMSGVILAQYGSGAPVITEDGKVVTRNDSGTLGVIGTSFDVKIVFNDGTSDDKVIKNGERLSVGKSNVLGYYLDKEMTVEWEKGNILSDMTIYVKLSQKVTWDVDGVETTEEIVLGDEPVAPVVPVKAPTADTVYTFSKWDSAVDEKGNITMTAVFTESPRTYTVSYVTDDGVLLFEKEVVYGAAPDLSVAGSKASDVMYDYTFVKWVNPDGSKVNLTSVTEDITLMGEYTSSDRDYTTVVPEEVTVGLIAAAVFGGLIVAFLFARKN